jgi:hypothetical protein
MIHPLEGALLGVLSKVSREREGKKDREENLSGFGTNSNYFKKYPKFSKNIFLKDKQFVEENEECFEIIF